MDEFRKGQQAALAEIDGLISKLDEKVEFCEQLGLLDEGAGTAAIRSALLDIVEAHA